MRLGVFGGSFDPVHYGHLLLAETCREARQLDEVWFMPTAVAPHKQDQQAASSEHRTAMLNLALGGHSNMFVSDHELRRGGVSYTVDTLAIVQQDRPAAELFLLMGADSLHDLPNWRKPDEICARATPVVVVRGGATPPDYSVLADIVSTERLKQVEEAAVDFPAIQLSSTELRDRVRTRRSIRFRTPRAVEAYIESHRLYRPTD